VEWALDRAHPVDGLQAADDVLHGSGDPGLTGPGGGTLALHEHLLGHLLRKVGRGDHVLAALGLAVAGFGLLQIRLANAAADHRGDDDEGDPAEDRGPAVRCTPTAGTRCKVVGVHSHLLLNTGREYMGEPPSGGRPGTAGLLAS